MFFNNGASKEFATGRKVKACGHSSMAGLEVQILTEMEGGTGTGQDQRSTAPVAGAEIGRATAFSDPVIVQILSFLTPGRRIFRPGHDRGQN